MSFPVTFATAYAPNINFEPMSRTVCRYFANGNNCRYGTSCRYVHPPPERDVLQHDTANESNVPTNCTTVSSSLLVNNTPNGVTLSADAPEFVPTNFVRTAAASIEPTETLADNGDQHTNDESNADDSTAANTRSYAQIVSGNASGSANSELMALLSDELMSNAPLCPYLNRIATVDGLMCPYGRSCVYNHGDQCDICNEYCLHPTDEAQRREHRNKCMVLLEKDMHLSFAVAKSKDKTCGICFEVITEKLNREHRFGILPNCNHIFCLQCIRKWRQAKNFDSTITRACPECRVTSNYVCPSLYWVDTKEEKDLLLSAYKGALGQQNCKYFNKGQGTCKFGNKCFYAHRLPSGELVDIGEPHQRRRVDLNGEADVYQQLLLWDFLEVRDNISSDDDFQSFISTLSNNSDLGIV